MEAEFVSHDLLGMPARESYALLTAFVSPRPIALVSTVGHSGVPNLAPFSFFMAGGSNPPSLCFSPTLDRRGEEKDSLRNIRETGEFVINVVHRPILDGMNATSASLPPEESEWGVSGFTALASDLVRPNRVAESLAQIECRLFTIVDHGAGLSAARYVIGEAIRLHASVSLWKEGTLDVERIRLIGRLSGTHYLDAAEGTVFELPRPN